jgi:NitT/TauT family transport system substrate-binding protein
MKKFISIALVSALMLMSMTACGSSSTTTSSEEESSEAASVAESSEESSEESSAESSAEASSEEESSEEADSSAEKLDVTMNIAFLKGPTGLGALELMDKADKGETAVDYNITIVAAADEIVSGIGSGEFDLAAAPVNLGSTLYNKTSGEVSILAVNTLGVLYLMQKGDVTVSTIEDLRGMDIISSGEGTVAQYEVNYILSQNGIDPETDVNITYYSEHSEAAAALAASENAVAILPQPFVTTVSIQNEDISIALDLTEEWNKVATDCQLLTGCVIGRDAYIEANPEAIDAFLTEYAESTAYVTSNVDEAAALSEQFDLFPAAVAKKAIPNCNIVFMEGAEMQSSVEGFLSILFDYAPASIGGALPGEDFYFAR